MERLTEQLRWWASECDRTNFGCQARKMLDEAADRLAYYEDLEEQGRLVVLPCKVGDEFWAEYCGEVRKVKVSMITQKADGTWKVRFSVDNGWGSSINGSMGVIGKTVFLTSEEAEAALKE